MKKFVTIAAMLFSFSVASIPEIVEAAPKKVAKKSSKKKIKKKKKKGAGKADFSPVNFLPFGVGQFVQGRPLMGAVLGGGQAAMLFLYMDRKSQITASNNDANATIADINANGGTPDEETADYLKRNADYVDKTNTEANLCLLGFAGLWGVSVVEAVWDPFGSRKAVSSKTAELEELEDSEDEAAKWAKEEELDRLKNKARFSAFALPSEPAKPNTTFGISFEKNFR